MKNQFKYRELADISLFIFVHKKSYIWNDIGSFIYIKIYLYKSQLF